MYYFIPAWYGSHRQWHADIIPWYRSSFKLEFDDTFNQIRLLDRQELPSSLLVLAYQPHLRYFLHRHSVLEAEVYSIFDEMQDITDISPQVLNIRDIEWDKDCEFMYSPFAIVIHKDGKRYAQIEHGVEGFISDIQYFDAQDHMTKHYIMDDRGLVSSVIYYQDNHPSYQDYLNTEGIWQFREYLQEDGRVEINPIFGYRFNSLYYSDMGQLVAEFFEKRIEKIKESSDWFIVPSDSRHNDFVLDCLPEVNPKILSLFIGRNPKETMKDLLGPISKVDLVLVDREDSLELLQNLYPDKQHLFKHLSPFDTRLRLGESQTKKESIIYYQLNFEEDLDKEGLFQVLSFLAETKDTEVIFGAFAANNDQMQRVAEAIQEIIDEKFSAEIFEKEVDYEGAENPLKENAQQQLRYSLLNINDELEMMKTLEYVRLIVDLNPQPHLYTQIAGISAGIPQVNQVETAYVDHLKNGYLLSTITEFKKAAHYYLDTLKEWNQSLIYSIDKIKEHTGQRFVEKLDQWIEESTNVKGS